MRPRTLLAAVSVLCLTVLSESPLRSQTVTSNAIYSDWLDTGSWVGGVVPTAADTVIIVPGAYISVYSTGAACKVLILQNDTIASYFGVGKSAELTVGGGTGAVIMGNEVPPLTHNYWQYFYAGGTLNCGSIAMTGRRKSGYTENVYFSINDTPAVINIAGNIIMDRDSSTSGSCVVTFGAPGIIHLGGKFSQVGFGEGYLGMLRGTLDYNGTSGQTIAPFTYANLELSGSGSKTMEGNVTVNDTLELNGIELNTGGNTLTLSDTATVTRTTGLVNGNLKKVYADTGSFTFPSGTPGEYTPVRIRLTGSTPDFGFTVSAAHGTPAGVIDPTRALKHSWTIAPYGAVTSYDMVFTWVAADAPFTMNEGSAVAGRSTNPGSVPWTEVGGKGDAVFHTGTITGQSGTWVWTWGDPGALPIELGSFSARVIAGEGITLEWSTMSETNNLGFYVERRKNPPEDFATVSDLVPGAGTTLEEHRYSWTDTAAAPGTYFYRLRQVNLDGRITHSFEITVALDAVLGARGREAVPGEYALRQNYPNPFNPATLIRYQLPEAGDVTLKIYNALGEEVATLVDAYQTAGYKSAEFSAVRLPSGVYFYRLTAGSFMRMRKALLVR